MTKYKTEVCDTKSLQELKDLLNDIVQKYDFTIKSGYPTIDKTKTKDIHNFSLKSDCGLFVLKQSEEWRCEEFHDVWLKDIGVITSIGSYSKKWLEYVFAKFLKDTELVSLLKSEFVDKGTRDDKQCKLIQFRISKLNEFIDGILDNVNTIDDCIKEREKINDLIQSETDNMQDLQNQLHNSIVEIERLQMLKKIG